MLISLADEFGVSVSDLLGEAISESASDELRAISEKLEVINLQLSNRHSSKVKTIRWLLISLCAFMRRDLSRVFSSRKYNFKIII